MTDCIKRYFFPHNLPSSPLISDITVDELDEIGDHNYRIEANRLKSYKDWPCSWMKPERLAAAGFYYTGESDKVKCFECLVEICQWQSDDNPMVDHQRWSDRCRFVRNIPCGNVPIGVDPVTIPEPSPKGKDVCGPYGMVYMPLSSGPDNELDLDFEETVRLSSLAESKLMQRPKHPQYASYDARLRTFDSWPISMRQKKEDLTEAGFYYTGNSDQTMCYHCGGGLKNWEPNDDPWQQHARWFEHCPYVLTVKGREYVSDVTGRTYYKEALEEYLAEQANESHVRAITRTSSLNSVASGESSGIESVGSASSNESSNVEEPIGKAIKDKPIDKDARMCKICYSRELRMVFIPCGHLLACAECAKNMKICGVCRKPVRVTVQAYIP